MSAESVGDFLSRFMLLKDNASQCAVSDPLFSEPREGPANCSLRPLRTLLQMVIRICVDQDAELFESVHE